MLFGVEKVMPLKWKIVGSEATIQKDWKGYFDNELERKIPFPDIVKLIGNLLDNATEATLVNDNKRLKFSLIEDDNKVNIRMSNLYDWKSGERFNDFLIDGKSTKGVRRGLGMTNIKEILERYHGSLQVTFDYDDEVKIIQFEIMLPI